MIEDLEKATSGRSNCTVCKKRIKKDELRGIESYVTGFGRHSTRFYCKKCAKKILRRQKEKNTEMLKQLE